MSKLFSDLGGEFVELDTVLEASLPLELSGEMVRGRICIFTDEDGREWALRPDLTLPAAVNEIARRRAGGAGKRTVCYDASVFRLPASPKDPIEFRQAGFERFGYKSDAQNDADMFTAIANAVSAFGVTSPFVQFGDLSIFPAFVDAMGLPPETKQGLKRAFRQEGGVRAYLSAEKNSAAMGLSRRMRGMDQKEATAFVEDVFKLTGIRPVGERTEAEIVDRLYQRAQDGVATEISEDDKSILEAALAIDAPASEAANVLRDLSKGAGLKSLDPQIEALDMRLQAIAAADPKAFQTAQFSTRFGRRFTYYDGFVFELAASRQESEAGRPFAAGGRYDSLLSQLSAGEVEASAMGGVIIPHRIEIAKGEQA